ncbi:MAG: DUF4983 domain-containing protein [Niabella sp.]
MRNIYLLLVTICAVLIFTPSCKKYADPPPYFEEDSTAAIVGKRKVLLIGIDGLPGKEFTAINPPVLTAMLPKSKYTFNNAVDEEVSSDPASWKTLLSGVTFARHLVRDSTFESLQKPSEGQPGRNYPSLFYFILRSASSDLKSRMVSSWSDLLTLLTPEASVKVATGGDAATKDSVVAALKNNNDDLLVAHFAGASAAGKAGSFSASNAGYKAAVLQIDTYIGEIMAALKARPGYNNEEDWLVIVTGTHGGKGNSYGGNSDEELRVPSIYYNEKFKSNHFVASDFSSPLLGTGPNDPNAILNDANGVYNFGTPGDASGVREYTVEIKVKILGANTNYPSILSKRAAFNPGVVGWTVFLEGDHWRVNFGQVGQNNTQIVGTAIRDEKWHTLSFVIKNSGATRLVRTFTDGVFNNQGDITAKGDLNTTAPLTLGYLSPTSVSARFNSTDIRIFNVALSDDEVKNNLCLTDMAAHPKYNNLIGYWPCSDGFGSKLKNLAPNYQNLGFNLTGTYEWAEVSPLPCTITPGAVEAGQVKLQLSSAGIPSTIFYWLKVAVNSTWGIETSNWLSLYESEFLPIQ